MVPETMSALRNISPLSSTAALLPNYKLRFHVAGIPGLEPSAAAIEPVSTSTTTTQGDRVHGVLYELTEDDFARVGSTEGVPSSYRWQACEVYPYVGNAQSAGEDAWRLAQTPTVANLQRSVSAYTLIAGRPAPNDIPPSKSYRDLLVEGAMLWNMDQDYVQSLEEIPIASNLFFLCKDGLAKTLLQAAQARKEFF